MKTNKLFKLLFWVFILSLVFSCKKEKGYFQFYAVNNTSDTINLKVWMDKYPSNIVTVSLVPGEETRQTTGIEAPNNNEGGLTCYKWCWSHDSIFSEQTECANGANLFITY